jgi:hypothetical protein
MAALKMSSRFVAIASHNKDPAFWAGDVQPTRIISLLRLGMAQCVSRWTISRLGKHSILSFESYTQRKNVTVNLTH